MSWENKLKAQKRDPKLMNSFTLSTDMYQSQKAYDWITQKSKTYKTSRSAILRAIIEDAFEREKK